MPLSVPTTRPTWTKSQRGGRGAERQRDRERQTETVGDADSCEARQAVVFHPGRRTDWPPAAANSVEHATHQRQQQERCEQHDPAARSGLAAPAVVAHRGLIERARESERERERERER